MLAKTSILHEIPCFEIILNTLVVTEVALAQTQVDNFLGSLLSIGFHFLAEYTVEGSPLQGRAEETLPDMSTEGVDLICSSSHETMT